METPITQAMDLCRRYGDTHHHLIVYGARRMSRAFFALVDRTLAASMSHELLVYVHGSNNTVPRAAAQAAQLRHFTGRRMVVLSFQWPSAGSALKYLTDVGNASASVDPFVRLLELLAANTKATAIDVLAYSAGAQIVSPGLAKLGTARPGESREQVRQRLRLKHVYYAAPDIDTRRFVNELTQYVDVVDRVSIAANLNDSALRVAGLIHRASRASQQPDRARCRTNDLQDRRLAIDGLRPDPRGSNDIPKLPLRSHASGTRTRGSAALAGAVAAERRAAAARHVARSTDARPRFGLSRRTSRPRGAAVHAGAAGRIAAAAGAGA